MNIGEYKTDLVTVPASTTVTITVPNNETWEFENIAVTRIGSMSIRVTNGTDTVETVSAGNIGQVSNTSAGLVSLIVDGSNEDVKIRSTSNGEEYTYYAATRVS